VDAGEFEPAAAETATTMAITIQKKTVKTCSKMPNEITNVLKLWIHTGPKAWTIAIMEPWIIWTNERRAAEAELAGRDLQTGRGGRNAGLYDQALDIAPLIVATFTPKEEKKLQMMKRTRKTWMMPKIPLLLVCTAQRGHIHLYGVWNHQYPDTLANGFYRNT
jgi:hypothetical protein